MKVQVESYCGHRGGQAPRRIMLGDRHLEVVTVARAWLEPECRCFEVECDDGRRYVLRHFEHEDAWRLGGSDRIAP